MHAENWNTQHLELEGWPMRLTCYQLGQTHVAEVECCVSGAIVARATGRTVEQVERDVIRIATKRLRATRIDPRLTVGG